MVGGGGGGGASFVPKRGFLLAKASLNGSRQDQL
jgi:hypothetical protein